MASYYCGWGGSKLRCSHFEPGFIGLGDDHFIPFCGVSCVSLLSLAAKKVTKKAAETYYCISFRGATIKLECYCGTGLRDVARLCDVLSFILLFCVVLPHFLPAFPYFLWRQRK